MAKKYYVASGKSVLTTIGMRGPGEEVTADMLSGGKEAFEKLIASEKKVLTSSEPVIEEVKKEEPVKVESVKEEAKDAGAKKK